MPCDGLGIQYQNNDADFTDVTPKLESAINYLDMSMWKEIIQPCPPIGDDIDELTQGEE